MRPFVLPALICLDVDDVLRRSGRYVAIDLIFPHSGYFLPSGSLCWLESGPCLFRSFARPAPHVCVRQYFSDSGFAQSTGQIGSGNSMHITSLDGAALSIPCFGTKIQLLGNLTGDATISLTLDNEPVEPSALSVNADNSLATLSDLSHDQHVITLKVKTSGATNSFVVFDRALVDTIINSTFVLLPYILKHALITPQRTRVTRALPF